MPSKQRNVFPMEETDIWRAAHILVLCYGEGASMEICRRADDAMARGDNEAQITWKRVLDIAELPQHAAASTDSLH